MKDKEGSLYEGKGFFCLFSYLNGSRWCFFIKAATDPPTFLLFHFVTILMQKFKFKEILMLRFFYSKYLDQRRNSNERTSRARSQRKNGVSSQRKFEYEASRSAI